METASTDQNIETIKETFLNSGLGVDLTDAELEEVAKIAIEKKLKKKTTIVAEDSDTRDLFIIYKGRVSVRLMLPFIHFQEEVIGKMEDNEIFGEFSLANGAPRSASIRADTEVTVHQYDYKRIVELMENNTRIGYIVMRNIAGIIANRIRENHKKTRKLVLGI